MLLEMTIFKDHVEFMNLLSNGSSIRYENPACQRKPDAETHAMNEIRKPSEQEKILASTFAHHWSDARNVSASQIIAAMLGLSAPIIVGAATGHLQSGVAAALGGFAMGMQQGSGALRSRISNLI